MLLIIVGRINKISPTVSHPKARTIFFNMLLRQKTLYLVYEFRKNMYTIHFTRSFQNYIIKFF